MRLIAIYTFRTRETRFCKLTLRILFFPRLLLETKSEIAENNNNHIHSTQKGDVNFPDSLAHAIELNENASNNSQNDVVYGS